MIDFWVCSMSEKMKKKKEKTHQLTNKLNNVSLGPDPFIAGQCTVVPIQNSHFFFISSSNTYYYHRDRDKCIGRMDEQSLGIIHVFIDQWGIYNN